MKGTPRIHHLKDIWNAYCLSLIGCNEGWVGMPDKGLAYYSMYRKYTDQGKPVVIEAMNYPLFVEVITEYFAEAKEYIIKGEVLNLGNRLGKIAARRVQRDHKKKSIDFAKTATQPSVWNEEKQKMTRKLIYYTTDDWCRIGWHKNGAIKNETVYEFRPTKNLKRGHGFNQQFSNALKKDPILKFKYLYYPLKSQRKKS